MKLQTVPLRFRVWDKQEERFLDGQDFAMLPTSPDWGITLTYQKQGMLATDEAIVDWSDADLISGRYEISQDTGLKDKNGRRIFAGDLVVCWDDAVGQVYYDEGLLQMRVEFDDGDDEDLASCEPEVVGNIWETPGLLEGEYD